MKTELLDLLDLLVQGSSLEELLKNPNLTLTQRLQLENISVPRYYQRRYLPLDIITTKDKKYYMFLSADKDLWAHHSSYPKKPKNLRRIQAFCMEYYQNHYLFDKYRLRTNIDQQSIEILFRACLGKLLDPIMNLISSTLWFIIRHIINIHYSHYYLFLTYKFTLDCNANKLSIIVEYIKHIFFVNSIGRKMCFEITLPLITQWCWFNAYYWCFVEDDETDEDLDMDDWWEAEDEHPESLPNPDINKWFQNGIILGHYEGRTFIHHIKRYYNSKTRPIPFGKFIAGEQDRWIRFWTKYNKKVAIEQEVLDRFKQYVKDYESKEGWFGIRRYCKFRFIIMFRHARKRTWTLLMTNFLHFSMRATWLLFIVWEFFRYFERIQFDLFHYNDDFKHYEYFTDRFYSLQCWFDHQHSVTPNHYWFGHTMDWRIHPYRYYKYGYRWAPRSRPQIYLTRVTYKRYHHPGYLPHQL